MKKLKLLIPTLGIAALGSAVVPAITSCSQSSTSVKAVLDIDADNILHGFKSGLTTAQIEEFCKGTLTIPSTVKKIDRCAFYDWKTDKSLIPSSIKNLVFEEYVDVVEDEDTGETLVVGYSQLHNEVGGTPAIGDFAFKNAPFISIKLPLGSGYDIGESAFEATKITCLEMPHPRYAEESDFAEEKPHVIGGSDKPGYWRGFLTSKQELSISVKDYFNSHRVNFRSKAFYNTPTLNSIILSPFINAVDFNTQSGKSEKVFTILNDSGEHYSNISCLDFTEVLSPCRRADDEQKGVNLGNYQSEFNEINNSGVIKVDNFCKAVGASIFEPAEAEYVSKMPALIFNSFIEEQGNQDGQKEYHNRWLAALNFPTVSTAWQISSNMIATYPSKHYIDNSKTGEFTTIDKFDTDKKTATLSIAKTGKLEQPITLPFQGNDTTVQTAGLRGNIEYKITKVEWNGAAVPLTFEHITLDDFDESQESEAKAYLNNQFAVVWEENKIPTAGSNVLITYDTICKDMARSTTGMQLEITFEA